ncbi:hypothetical protein HPP92_021132 [Vanilla planifolia]|uniref:Uncharacterized protein n=1 Tax=Vanilla planifolia TaxID=51239 RepID=A0A835UKF2_VANPL|nr:hypothetical protein HPP92_021132 [Vanilla planifolia]
MQVESSNHLSRIPSSIDLDATIDIDQCSRQTSKEEDNCNTDGKNAIYLHGLTDSDVPSAKEVTPPGNQTPVPATGRANDRFWEQFLTERPGSSDTEEASSSLKEDACEEQEEMIMKDDRWRNIKDMEQLTL